MADFTLRTGNYKAIKVDPAAAVSIGDYAVYSEVAGFYLQDVTTAQAADSSFRAALVVEAEQVTVDKTTAETWVAGQEIFWNASTGKATNVYASGLRRIGWAREAGANGDTTGEICFDGKLPNVALGGGLIMTFGVAAVTGSDTDIDTGLSVISQVFLSLKDANQAATDAAYATADFGADGLLDIYCWDDAGVAAVNAATVAWMAIGTP